MKKNNIEIPHEGDGASSPKIRVLVDMDGVLCDFDAGVNREYALRHPDLPLINLETERPNFYMKKNYKEKYGAEAAERVMEIVYSEGFFRTLDPIPGGIEALKLMDADPAITVLLCTSPLSCYKYVLCEKYEWVHKHLGEEWVKRIVMTKDKTVVSGDILIDDRPTITGDVEDPTWEHILFDQPYNRHIKGKRSLKHWDQWRSIVDGLKETTTLNNGETS